MDVVGDVVARIVVIVNDIDGGNAAVDAIAIMIGEKRSEFLTVPPSLWSWNDKLWLFLSYT